MVSARSDFSSVSVCLWLALLSLSQPSSAGDSPQAEFESDSAFFASIPIPARGTCVSEPTPVLEPAQGGLFGQDQTQRITQLVSSEDGQWIVSRRAGVFQLWRTADDSLSAVLRIPCEVEDLSLQPAFSSNSNELRVPTRSGGVACWRLEKGSWRFTDVPGLKAGEPTQGVAWVVSGLPMAGDVTSSISPTRSKLIYSSRENAETVLCIARDLSESPVNFDPVLRLPGAVSSISFVNEDVLVTGDFAGRIFRVRVEELFASRVVLIAGDRVLWAPSREPSRAFELRLATTTHRDEFMRVELSNNGPDPAPLVVLRIEGLSGPIAFGTVEPGQTVSRTVPAAPGSALAFYDQLGRHLRIVER